MWNRKHSVTLSLAVCYALCVVLTAGLFMGPWVVKMWFTVYRGWNQQGVAMERMLTEFVICFYPCAMLGYVTLYSLIRLLRNIQKDDIFVTPNVRYLRRISWCCLIVSVITFVAGVFYLPYLFIAFAAGFVGLMLRVVKNVMENAVQLKEENELTI